MALFLEIVQGVRIGTRFSVRAGATLGRKAADILLEDAKVSSKHAVIESRADGFYLVDAKSANGIKVDDAKVPEVRLSEGLRLQIGRTRLLVVESEVEAGAPAAAGGWIPLAQSVIRRALESARDEAIDLRPFNPPLELVFVQGRQTGVEWTVGYGPRDAGAVSVDLAIEEPGAPAVCFQLVPDRAGRPVFRTQHRESVRLNGEEIAECPVSDGDVIDIANTRIQVRSGKAASRS